MDGRKIRPLRQPCPVDAPLSPTQLDDMLELALELKPDLIICDILMPGLDGFATCRAVRALPEGENLPIVILRDVDGQRVLPIWVGAVEANAVALQIENVAPPRPLTHDLVNDILKTLHAPCERVEITKLEDGVFYSDLVLANGMRVSARPSDAVAIALRAGVPIYATDEVLDAAAIIEGPQGSDAELDAFRAFLEDVSPEDFNAD